MRRVKLPRNGEQYEEANGSYGGIRKLGSEEIQTWKKLLPLYHQIPVYIPSPTLNNFVSVHSKEKNA